MPELWPARIRREAQGTGEAGAEPACARRKAFSALFRPEKGLAGRRPVKASASIQCAPLGATHSPDRKVHGERSACLQVGRQRRGNQEINVTSKSSEERSVGK